MSIKGWIISVGSLLVVGMLVFIWLSSDTSAPAALETDLGVKLPISVPADTRTGGGGVGTGTDTGANTISLSTVDAGSVRAADFLRDPDTVPDPINAGYYYLGYQPYEYATSSAGAEAAPYIITYISATNYFNIALVQEPIGPNRDAAERYLISRLGLAPGDLCRLNYMVSVPDRVNSTFSGISLGFSFCPGATQLPK